MTFEVGCVGGEVRFDSYDDRFGGCDIIGCGRSSLEVVKEL